MNILDISFTFGFLKLLISRLLKDTQFSNIRDIFSALEVSNFETSILFKLLQSINRPEKSNTFFVSNLDKSKDSNKEHSPKVNDILWTLPVSNPVVLI